MLSSDQFDRIQRLALSVAGLELVERHRELLDRRSQRVGILDSARLDALLGAVEQGETAATQQFIRLLTTKFTGFFRHSRHFELAAKHALRVAQRRGQARLWSAGTATGEEAYSLAMVLIDEFRSEDPPVLILATDVDAAALETAQRGEYDEGALQTLEPARRERFFCKTGIVGRMGLAAAVRRLVEFRLLNLAGAAWPVEGPFDVIFCRNVLMYQEASHRHAVLERMASLLAPEGLLMLDPTEHPGKAAPLFTPGVNGIYARQRTSCPQRAEGTMPDLTPGREDCFPFPVLAHTVTSFPSNAGYRR